MKLFLDATPGGDGMQTLTGKLRWYPGDALVEIRREDLEKIADQCGVNITLNEVEGKRFVYRGENGFGGNWK